MELESLKEQWELLNKKIQHTELINQKIVNSIITSRVMTTVDKIKRMYFSFYFVLTRFLSEILSTSSTRFSFSPTC
jgi:hypothetical protein